MMPASAGNAVTVAASDINDARAWFSNKAPCVDIFAPGVNIYSALPPNSYGVLSGVSCCICHVLVTPAVMQPVRVGAGVLEGAL